MFENHPSPLQIVEQCSDSLEYLKQLNNEEQREMASRAAKEWERVLKESKRKSAFVG